jgi:tetratricopeptide (TPR) repeat protein
MEVLGSKTVDVGNYSDIGFLEIRHRMFEQALETFTMGREAFRSRALFSQELTQVHTALGDYDSAIDECVLTVNQHSGAVSWATNFIELMLEEGARRGDVRARMAEIARNESATVAELGLAGSVFLVLDSPERALDTFLRADEVAGREGTELLGYAEILVDDGREEQAREAYLMIVERHPGSSNAARAGTAAAELLAEAGDPVGAVAELRTVADAFDGMSWGAQALFEAARVELDVLGDAGAALSTVAELRNRFGDRARRMNAELTMIEVDAYTKQGRFDEAYGRASELALGEVPRDIQENALFAKGFISFLNHDYAKATDEFRELVKTDAASALVNDAIRLMLVIARAQDDGDSEPVRLLAEAHAARLAGDMSLSEELLLDLAEGATDEAVRNEALLLLGAMATRSGDARRAVSHYDRVIDGSEAITARAVAMMRKADILWHTMGRTGDAADQYLAILEDLPSNVLSGEARRKLDSLRRGEGVEG